MSDVEEVIIATEGSNKNMLVFALKSFKGNPLFDIRKCYKNECDDIIRTKKGISLTKRSFRILNKVLEEHKNEIDNWLSINKVLEDVRKHLNKIERFKIDALFNPQPYISENKHWKSPEFFKVIAEGGINRLVLNEKHPLFSKLNHLKNNKNKLDHESSEDTSLKAIIELIILSYVRAKHLLSDQDITDSQVFFEILEMNWGVILERYLKY